MPRAVHSSRHIEGRTETTTSTTRTKSQAHPVAETEPAEYRRLDDYPEFKSEFDKLQALLAKQKQLRLEWNSLLRAGDGDPERADLAEDVERVLNGETLEDRPNRGKVLQREIRAVTEAIEIQKQVVARVEKDAQRSECEARASEYAAIVTELRDTLGAAYELFKREEEFRRRLEGDGHEFLHPLQPAANEKLRELCGLHSAQLRLPYRRPVASGRRVEEAEVNLNVIR